MQICTCTHTHTCIYKNVRCTVICKSTVYWHTLHTCTHTHINICFIQAYNKALDKYKANASYLDPCLKKHRSRIIQFMIIKVHACIYMYIPTPHPHPPLLMYVCSGNINTYMDLHLYQVCILIQTFTHVNHIKWCKAHEL